LALRGASAPLFFGTPIRSCQDGPAFRRTRFRLAEALSTVERVSLLDELTGIPNRRAFDQALEERTKEAVREGRPLSVLMIDIDHFKTFNDTLGHPEGGVALRSVARLLAGTLRRPADFIRAREPDSACQASGRSVSATMPTFKARKASTKASISQEFFMASQARCQCSPT
jgi:hypothetical protein